MDLFDDIKGSAEVDEMIWPGQKDYSSPVEEMTSVNRPGEPKGGIFWKLNRTVVVG